MSKKTRLYIKFIFFIIVLFYMFIHYKIITPIKDEEIINNATLQSYPTPISVYAYDGQTTDGKLVLFIEISELVCFKINESIKVKLIFKNLSEYPIIITSEFDVVTSRWPGGGNLHAIIKNSEKGDVFTLGDKNITSDTFETSPKKYTTINGNSKVVFYIEYQFPKYVFHDLNNQVRVTPIPEDYFIRFIYSDYKREINNWDGAISSNQIKVCTKKG